MGDSDRSRAADDAVEALRGGAPAKLVVYLVDGTTKEIAVPDIRRRWMRIKPMLAGIGAWVRVEGVDRGGRVCGVFEHPDPEDDGGDDVAAPRRGGKTSEVAELTGITLQAQEAALARHEAMLRLVLDNNQRLLALISERLSQLERGYRDNVELAQEMVMQFAAPQNEAADLESSKMLQSLIPFVLPQLVQRSKPNGVKPTTTPEKGPSK